VKSTTLLANFDIHEHVRTVAIVGAGGKTSLMYSLAAALKAEHKYVVSTTSTKIFPPRSNDSPALILLEADPNVLTLPGLLSKHGHVTVAQAILPDGKLQGIACSRVEDLLEHAHAVVMEADGAAGRSIKAPETWEPRIPERADLVIPVVGLDCIGKPATEEWVFRLERFLAITGMKKGESIVPEAVANVLIHCEGSLKGVPPEAMVIPFLNKLDLLADYSIIAVLADVLARRGQGRIRKIVCGKLLDRAETRSFVLS